MVEVEGRVGQIRKGQDGEGPQGTFVGTSQETLLCTLVFSSGGKGPGLFIYDILSVMIENNDEMTTRVPSSNNIL